MKNQSEETNLVINGIATTSTEDILAQYEQFGGRDTWYYIGMEGARKIIKTAIIRALRKHEYIIMSNQKGTTRQNTQVGPQD